MSIVNHYNFESLIYDKLYGDFLDDLNVIRAMDPRGRVLEIFSGTGRLISNFEGGVGLDINENMLKKTDNKFQKVRGDALNLPFKKSFGFVIIALNSFLLFREQEKKRILQEANRSLQEGGKLYLDVINSFSLTESKFVISEYKGNDLSVRLELVPERIEDHYVLHYTYIFSKPFRKKEKTEMIIFPIPYRDLTGMLDECGFSIIKTYGDYDLSQFRENSDKVLICAEKKRNI